MVCFFRDQSDKPLPFATFRVFVGLVSLLTNSEALEIEEIIIHPDYVFPQGDIALVKVSVVVNTNSNPG